MAATMRVLARGDILVLDSLFAVTSGGKRRFVGRSCITADASDKLPSGCVVREVDPVDPGDNFYVEGWARNPSPATVPAEGEFGAYYRARVKEGGLWPADEATAALCGVPFDAAFGGDYPQAATTGKRGAKDGD